MVNPFEETLEAGRINPREEAAKSMMQVGIGSLGNQPKPQYETVGDQMRGEEFLQMNDWGGADNYNTGRTSLFKASGSPLSLRNAIASNEFNLNPALLGTYWGKIGLRDAVKDHRENVLDSEKTLGYLQSEIFFDEMAREAGYHPSGTNLRQGTVGIERLWDVMKGKLGVGAGYDVDDSLFNLYLKYSH